MKTVGLKLRQNVPGQDFEDLDRSENKFFIEDEVVCEESDVENFLSITFKCSAVQSQSLDCTLKCLENYFLLIGLQCPDNFQKFVNVIAINDKRNCNVFGLQLGLRLLILVKQLRHERWKFVVDIGHNNVDYFFENSI
jgi:hypothetical protein